MSNYPVCLSVYKLITLRRTGKLNGPMRLIFVCLQNVVLPKDRINKAPIRCIRSLAITRRWYYYIASAKKCNTLLTRSRSINAQIIELNINMFKLNKIRGHIKMLELQQLKLTRYLAESTNIPVPNPERIKDINRALKRVTDNINMWKEKLSAFEVAPPRIPTRTSVLDDDPNKPLIG